MSKYIVDLQQELNAIRTTPYGKTMRPNLADAIEKLNKRHNALSETFDNLVIDAGNSNAEVVDARNDAISQPPINYNTIGERLNAMQQEIIDNKNNLGDYLPLTGGVVTGGLNVTGNLQNHGNPVWHSGNFDPSNKRDNLAPTNGAYHQGTPLISADGTMDIGSAIDFHATGGSQRDYDVRVKSIGGEQLELTGSLVSGQNNGYSIGVRGARFSTGEFETTFTDRVDTRSGDLRLRGEGGNANIIVESSVIPTQTNTYTIGENGRRFSTGDIGALFSDEINTRAGNLRLRAQSGGASVEVDSTMIPRNDGQIYNGTANRRWHVLYSLNGVLNTSDERFKADIQDIDDEQFFEMVKGTSVNTYVMLNERKDKLTKNVLNSEENKQATANAERVQVGIIAQDMARFDCSKYILVHDEESDIYSINNYNFTSALMGALKVEIKKREELESLVKELVEEVKALKIA